MYGCTAETKIGRLDALRKVLELIDFGLYLCVSMPVCVDCCPTSGVFQFEKTGDYRAKAKAENKSCVKIWG